MKRLCPIVVACPLLLLAVCTTSIAQTTSLATRAPAAPTLASRPMTAAPRAPSAHSAAEASMVELQSTISQRQTPVQVTTGMLNSINEGNKAVAGNIGGGGGAPACKQCRTKAKRR